MFYIYECKLTVSATCASRSRNYYFTLDVRICLTLSILINNSGETKLGSPNPITRPYSFAKSKINFTMKDLENDLEEDDDYEISSIPITSSIKSLPKRVCKNEQNLDIGPNDSSNIENSDNEEEQLDKDSESNSDWYDYPESNSDDDSIPPLISNVTFD